MDKNSRVTLFAGVNFIFAPFTPISTEKRLEFEKLADEYGIKLTEFRIDNHQFTAARTANMPLNIVIGPVGPQVGQLLIFAPSMQQNTVEVFSREAQDIAEIFMKIWPNRQVLSTDATIRDLYDSTKEHAFQEIWETRLKQSPDSLSGLNRPVLGGGLRFVIPPTNEDPAEPLIEIKIESFLDDTRKIFLEAQVAWNKPQPPGEKFDPEKRLNYVDDYIQNEVVKFAMEE